MSPKQVLKISFIIFSFFTLHQNVSSQSLPINHIQDEQIKINSLLSDSLNFSIINRPLPYNYYSQVLSGNSSTKSGWWNRPVYNYEISLAEHFKIGIQPFSLKTTHNSRLPYSENNQAAWYGRGLTTELSGGLYLSSNYLTVNIHPHMIYQQNQNYLHPRFIQRDNSGNPLYLAEYIGDGMDAPFRFGTDPFSTFDWGSSSIRLHYQSFETGISTEPLWWGPTIKYPLIMSNNAPGIPHFFIATRNPITIPYFGNIQFRWIFGYPEESEYFRGRGAGETRFTNALNFAYSPEIFPNLTIGLTRVFHLYEVDGFSFSNVTRMFDPFSRSRLVRIQGEDDIRQDRNQIASAYFHLKLPEANAEIYAEYYREDHSYDFRDFINQPHHNSGYAFGFSKISNAPFVEFIKTNLEFTNLTTSQLRQVRHQTFFYTHSRIRQGHTNRGQILGAAIGPGSNSQFFGMDAYKGNYKFGIFAQRVVDNDNFHFREGSASLSPSDFGDYFRHRVDLNFGLNFLYAPGPFYLNSRLVWTKAYNYGRFDYGDFIGVTVSNYERNDRTNVQFQIGITYVF